MKMKKAILAIVLSVVVAAGCGRKSPRPARVLIETSMGNITVELYDAAPLHRDNFLKLAEEGYYDSLMFHRVIDGFMIQAGDPVSRHAPQGIMLGSDDTEYTVPAEIDFPELFHRRGVLAAAREGDDVNPERNSSGSQFYIVSGKKFDDAKLDRLEATIAERLGHPFKFTEEQRKVYASEGGAPNLDRQYTVFGRVIEGMEVVDAIGKAATDAEDRPVQDIRILRMKVLAREKPSPDLSPVAGVWTEADPTDSLRRQGFVLFADGRASSVGRKTLLYKSWSTDGGTLTLRGVATEGGTPSIFSEGYAFSMPDSHTLCLEKDGQRMIYVRDGYFGARR